MPYGLKYNGDGSPAGPSPIHQVVFTLFDNGQVGAQATANPIATMKIVSMGLGALAEAFAKKEEPKIVQAPPGLRVSKLPEN